MVSHGGYITILILILILILIILITVFYLCYYTSDSMLYGYCRIQ